MFLQKLDLFGEPIQLNLKGKTHQHTCLGAFVSLFIYVFLTFFILLNSQNESIPLRQTAEMLIDPQNTEKYSKTNFKLFYTLNDVRGGNIPLSDDLGKFVNM